MPAISVSTCSSWVNNCSLRWVSWARLLPCFQLTTQSLQLGFLLADPLGQIIQEYSGHDPIELQGQDNEGRPIVRAYRTAPPFSCLRPAADRDGPDFENGAVSVGGTVCKELGLGLTKRPNKDEARLGWGNYDACTKDG